MPSYEAVTMATPTVTEESKFAESAQPKETAVVVEKPMEKPVEKPVDKPSVFTKKEESAET